MTLIFAGVNSRWEITALDGKLLEFVPSLIYRGINWVVIETLRWDDWEKKEKREYSAGAVFYSCK